MLRWNTYRSVWFWIGSALTMFALSISIFWLFLRASLPILNGEIIAGDLNNSVVVSRDQSGVPSINAVDRTDGAYVMGFLHAQERFFQMDLLRRSGAGELAELLGANFVNDDKNSRRFRFRAHARSALEQMDPLHRAILESYVKGVNKGLTNLNARPFEYLFLRTAPKEWLAEDSLLVIWAMYFVLQSDQEPREFARGWLKDNSTTEQLAILLQDASQFDAPLDAGQISNPEVPFPPSAPVWFGPASTTIGAVKNKYYSAVGSNSWALSGRRSIHGGAILANDMHLQIRLPNTWYRAAMISQTPSGVRHLVGVTLPGVPFFVVGSNKEVAWAFTNSYGDFLDLVKLEQDLNNPMRFKSAKGQVDAETFREEICIKDQESVFIDVIQTSFGPVQKVGNDYYATLWIAQHADAVNLRLLDLESADNIHNAADLVKRAGIPSQNVILVDSTGNIGWTIAGPLPNRIATNIVTFPNDSNLNFNGEVLRPHSEYPLILNPPDGNIWTANNRQLAGEGHMLLGDGGTDLGARAQQIRNSLQRISRGDEKAMYDIALDNQATFASIWREQALKALTDSAVVDHPDRAQFRDLLLKDWTNRAEPTSVGYRLARAYMYNLYDQLFGKLDEKLSQLPGEPSFNLASTRWPSLVLRLLKERPSGWLPVGKTWEDVELASIDSAIRRITSDGKNLGEATWGNFNVSAIAHPLADEVPGLRHWLIAPEVPLSGDDHMPLIRGSDFGQSERLVLSPGREEMAIFNMPGGQSGHPLSPFFLADHQAWIDGIPSPLLPQEEHYRLLFNPK